MAMTKATLLFMATTHLAASPTFAGDNGPMQKQILDPLSLQILAGKFHEGQTIRVDANDGKMTSNRPEDFPI